MLQHSSLQIGLMGRWLKVWGVVGNIDGYNGGDGNDGDNKSCYNDYHEPEKKLSILYTQYFITLCVRLIAIFYLTKICN